MRAMVCCRRRRTYPWFSLSTRASRPDETVSALTRCLASMIGGGYMVLTDRRLIFALKPDGNGRPPEMIAIPLGEISQFVFDKGVAAAA